MSRNPVDFVLHYTSCNRLFCHRARFLLCVLCIRIPSCIASVVLSFLPGNQINAVHLDRILGSVFIDYEGIFSYFPDLVGSRCASNEPFVCRFYDRSGFFFASVDRFGRVTKTLSPEYLSVASGEICHFLVVIAYGADGGICGWITEKEFKVSHCVFANGLGRFAVLYGGPECVAVPLNNVGAFLQLWSFTALSFHFFEDDL